MGTTKATARLDRPETGKNPTEFRYWARVGDRKVQLARRLGRLAPARPSCASGGCP